MGILRLPASLFPPGPSDRERLHRHLMGREEWSRIRARFKERILAERAAEKQALEARLAEQQAERERLAAEAAAIDSED